MRSGCAESVRTRLGARVHGGRRTKGRRQNAHMRISAKADYAVRAALELAAADDPPVKAERVAAAQGVPLKFLENILVDLRQGGVVTSHRGPEGGYRLDRSADEITLADV